MAYTYSKGAYRLGGHGRLFDHTFGGIYTVNRDCTMEMLFTQVPDPLNVPLPFTGTVADGGKEIQLIATAPGTVAPATLYKITMVGCSTEDFTGSFEFDMAGWVLEPTSRAGRFGRVGRLVSDGRGNFSAATLASYAGLLEVETFTGTYSMDSECKMVLRFAVTETLPRLIFPNFPGAAPGPPYSGVMEGLLYDRSNAVIMQTTPLGGVITGRLKR